MTIKQFVQTAFEGGWTPKWLSDESFNLKDDGYLPYYINSRILLDPEAWRAVDKVKQWDDVPDCAACDYPGWQNSMHAKMHGMIKAVIEGKTLEEYIETL